MIIKKFFEYNSVKIGDFNLNIDQSLDKYKDGINLFQINPIDINPKYSKKILKIYPFFKKNKDSHKYLEYSTDSGCIIIFEGEDDYFYISIINYNNIYKYKVDQFYELLKVLKILFR